MVGWWKEIHNWGVIYDQLNVLFLLIGQTDTSNCHSVNEFRNENQIAVTVPSIYKEINLGCSKILKSRVLVTIIPGEQGGKTSLTKPRK